MKYIGVLALVLSLQGCLYQTIDSYDIKRAIKECGSIENVHEIASVFTGEEFFTCFDKGVSDDN